MSLLDQAHKLALDQTRAEKPQQFTIGAYVAADGTVRGVTTYDRTWRNGWGLTAYAKAYWHDLSVTAHPKLEAGVEARKSF